MSTNQIPTYKPGKQAGYDLIARRYKSVEGKVIPKAEFEAGKGNNFFGTTLRPSSSHPQSALLGKFERLVAKAEKGVDVSGDPLLRQMGERFNYILAATKPYAAEQTRPIPPEIRASMRLVDYYYRAAGDLHAHAETPMQVATGGELRIQCPDPLLKRELEDEYERLGMWTVLSRNWMSAAQYGVGLPYEVWETNGEQDVRLNQIVDLPPYYVWIGFALPFGLSMAQPTDPTDPNFDKQANYALLPFNDGDRWTPELAKAQVMPMTFNSIGYNQNENLARGWNIPLANRYLQPVRAFSYGYERYPIIPSSRAFAPLGTRQIFDEGVRATIEGYQNQLWVFTLGTEKAMPRGDELIALQAALEGMSGERTGRLLWRYGLKVDLYAPKTLDQMLAAETRQSFTIEIFRQLGGNIRIETGNPLIGQRETAADKVDLSVWLRKLEYPRRVTLDWERYLRRKIVAAMGSPAAVEANRKTRCLWSRSLLEVSQVIEQELAPMYQMGWLSRQTGLEKAGESYDAELANKMAEQPDDALFQAPASFSQTTVRPETQPSRTSSTQPVMRMSAVSLEAAWDNDAGRTQLMQAVADNVQANLVQAPSVEGFCQALAAATKLHLGALTVASYAATGGAGVLTAEEADFSANFVNAFVDGFRSRLLADQQAGADLGLHASRAMLYATEGYKMAVINGQRAAMREKGARAWRRVVGADACPACRGDSTIMHAVAEPFTLVHVAESLAREELSVQYYSASGLPGLIMPVPSYTDETTELLKGLGSKQHTQRRARE